MANNPYWNNPGKWHDFYVLQWVWSVILSKLIRRFHFLFESFISAVRFQGYNQGAGTEAGGSFRGGHVDRGGYHGHRPYGRPYVPR